MQKTLREPLHESVKALTVTAYCLYLDITIHTGKVELKCQIH